MERRERRRRNFFDSLFDPPDPGSIGSAFEVRVLNLAVADGFAPATPVAKLWNGDDEVFVVPGQIQATVGGAAEAALRKRNDFTVVAKSGRVTTFYIRGDGGTASTRSALAGGQALLGLRVAAAAGSALASRPRRRHRHRLRCRCADRL